jgi:malate dehydrogenase (oxaloacetate-decarboxylating)(NADP+)
MRAKGATMADNISQDLKSGALFYHRYPRPGKLEIQPTKPLGNQRDLALAYSPGVATASEAIAADPAEAANLTSRQNLVAVITNGTAVLGLGDIGPLASKPVMEGKAVCSRSSPASTCSTSRWPRRTWTSSSR